MVHIERMDVRIECILFWQRLQIVPFIGDVAWVHVHFIQRARFNVSQVSTFAPFIWGCLNKTNTKFNYWYIKIISRSGQFF